MKTVVHCEVSSAVDAAALATPLARLAPALARAVVSESKTTIARNMSARAENILTATGEPFLVYACYGRLNKKQFTYKVRELLGGVLYRQ